MVESLGDFGHVWGDQTQYITAKKHGQQFLVGGWTNPFEKYARQIGSFPKFSGWKFQKYLSCHQPGYFWCIFCCWLWFANPRLISQEPFPNIPSLVGGCVCCDEVAVKHHQITQGAKHTACSINHEPLPCQCYPYFHKREQKRSADIYCSNFHGNLRVPPLCHPPQEIRPY